MSYTNLYPAGPGLPAAPGPLRVRILAGLAYSALDLRDRIARAAAGECADCTGRPCPDHAAAEAEAAGYEDAFRQVESGTREWCDLAVKLISEMNL